MLVRAVRLISRREFSCLRSETLALENSVFDRAMPCISGEKLLRFLVLSLLLVLTPAESLAQAGNPSLSSLGALTCQQLWYLEQEVLAENRVCLKDERAQRAFRNASPCISSNEGILSGKIKNYLAEVRKTGQAKNCPEF